MDKLDDINQTRYNFQSNRSFSFRFIALVSWPFAAAELRPRMTPLHSLTTHKGLIGNACRGLHWTARGLCLQAEYDGL